MAFNPQFKINQLAKDMGVKSRELSDLLARQGVEDVRTQKALTEAEFSVLFQTLTEEHQVDNILDYMDGKTYIPSKIMEKKRAEAKAEAERREAEARAEQERMEAEARARREQQEAEMRAAAERAEAEAKEKEARLEAERKDAERREAEEAAARRAAERAEAERAAIQRTAARLGLTRSGAGQRTASGAQTPARGEGIRGGAPRPAGTAGARPAVGASRSGAVGGTAASPAASQMVNGGNNAAHTRFEGPGRFGTQNREGQRPLGGSSRGPAGFGGGRPQGGRPEGGGANRGGARSGGGPRMDRDKGDYVPSAPREKFQFQPIVREQTPKGGLEASKPRGATRVVDTRVSTVDLAKYDEKLDTFVSEKVQDVKGGAQRGTRRAPTQTFGGRGASSGMRRQGRPSQKKSAPPVKKAPLHVQIPEEIMVSDLAARLKVTAAEVVKRLMLMGSMVTVNQTVDYDTASLVAEELGATVTKEVVVTIEEKLFDGHEDSKEDLVSRAPVVCVMGHVDHGKTSLLDAIRHTRVTAGEAGGITQHIGAYRVAVDEQEITFLDTPGHEAFTAMRARGAQATDIAILVVAADDGIMPQTVEAINHAKAAGVELIVAINKMDKPGADPENVKQELTQYELVPEEWGGDVLCVPVSALTGEGVDKLLESVLLVAEMKELKANPNRRAKGIVIESKLDKGKGPVATVLVQNGTLNNGDIVIAGTSVGRVRAMTDYAGRIVKSAGPSVPVEIIGLADVPEAGDEFDAVADERMARELADRRRNRAKEEFFKANARANLNDLFSQMKEGVKTLNIIVKADVDGTVEAVKASLQKLSNEEVRVGVIHAAVGGITEGDVTFAAASNAIIVGFNVRPDKKALDNADRQGVEIRTYRVIYECIEEIEAAMKGMLSPKYRENLLGHAEVRQTIHVPNVGTIAGSYITDGKIIRSAKIRIVRDGVVIFEDAIASLRRFKDDVREVNEGYECGVGLDRFNDIKVGDVLEAFIMEEIPR